MGRFLGMDQIPLPVSRAFLGLTIIERDGTLIVKAVIPGGPAADVNLPLEPGDRIREVNGVSCKSVADFQKAQRTHRPGIKSNFAIDQPRKEGGTESHQVSITPRGGF